MRKIITAMIVIVSLFCSTIVASAAADPNVMLVNPKSHSTIYSSSLLISVKLTQPKTIQVKVFEEKQWVNGTLSAINVNALTTTNGSINSASFTPVQIKTFPVYTSNSNLSFYTQQVNDLKPGLYLIQVDTLDASNKPVNTSSSHILVKEKTEDEKIFDTPQSGTMQFLQNLLKTIFGE